MDRNSLIFVAATFAATGLLLTSGYGFAGGLVVATVAFSFLWLVSLLLKVSGVAMLDAAMVERRPDYADYIATTPAFVPRLRFPHFKEGRGTGGA